MAEPMQWFPLQLCLSTPASGPNDHSHSESFWPLFKSNNTMHSAKINPMTLYAEH